MEEPILSVNNLSICIDQSKYIVKNSSFNVFKGKVLGIVGESGSGKTMTSKAILGLLSNKRNIEVKGEILFNGEDILNKSDRELNSLRGKDISMVVQNPMTAFNPLIKVGNHMIETLREHLNVSKKEARIRALNILEDMNLKNPERIMNSYSSMLSGGMLQRVIIGIATSLRPQILIADEPTTALDVENQKIIIEQLERIKREYDLGVIFISHDLSLISQIADEIIVMKNGEIVEGGSVHKIFYRPKHPYTKELINARLLSEYDLGEGEIARIK